MSKIIALKSKRVVTPNAVIQDGIVVIKDGRIDAVGTQNTILVPEDAEVIDYGNHIIGPGFLDIHCHGCYFGKAGESVDSTLALAKFLVSTGTTSFLPTVMMADKTKNVALARRAQKENGLEGAEMIGINMEGPFLEPKKVEGVNTGDDDLPLPNMELLEQILEDGEGGIRIMGVGILLPEVEKVVKRLREEGIVVAVTHTKANAQQFEEAVQMGFTHGTHLYNVMTGLHHRRPGVVGGFLTHDNMTAELISDIFHIHPWAVEVAIRCMGPDRLAIITDLTLAGIEDGEYDIESGTGSVITATVKGGIVRVKGSNENQDNTMIGCTVTINECVRNIVDMGYSLPVAFRMGSLTPARIIGMEKAKGSLEITKDADVIVIDDDFKVLATYVKGELLYRA